MRKAKLNGCGSTFCHFNATGYCMLDFIILDERGQCLLNKPDSEKIVAQQEIEALITQEDESESKANIIGFNGNF